MENHGKLIDAPFYSTVKGFDTGIPPEYFNKFIKIADELCIRLAENDQGSLQTSDDIKSILDHEGFEDIKRLFLMIAEGYMNDFYGEKFGGSVEVRKSWLVKSPKGTSQALHTHAGDLTVVMYLSDAESDLIIHNAVYPAPDTRVYDFFIRTRRPQHLQAKAGCGYIFPSYSEHSVGINQSDSPRYCLAADFVVKESLN